MSILILGVEHAPATLRAHEVPDAADWDDQSGSHFYFEPNAAELAAGNKETLSDFGWTTTALSFVEGAGADFLSLADPGVPAHFVTDGAGSILQSPAKFGSHTHGNQAGRHLGHPPTKMTFEFWFTFSVASNDETATGFGLTVAGGSIITEADAIAVIRSDGTNFVCRSNVDAAVGPLIDTALHLGKIEVSQGTTDAIQWFVDGASQGTLDLREDVLPMSWGAGTVGAGSNRVLIGPCEVSYG